jgi:hypothetical protein
LFAFRQKNRSTAKSTMSNQGGAASTPLSGSSKEKGTTTGTKGKSDKDKEKELVAKAHLSRIIHGIRELVEEPAEDGEEKAFRCIGISHYNEG